MPIKTLEFNTGYILHNKILNSLNINRQKNSNFVLSKNYINEKQSDNKTKNSVISMATLLVAYIT